MILYCYYHNYSIIISLRITYYYFNIILLHTIMNDKNKDTFEKKRKVWK